MGKLPKAHKTMQNIVVVGIPAYNEEQFISNVVSKAIKFTDKVVVIDDGSIDNTTKIAETVGALVINHGINKGYSECIRSCFEVANSNNADILVTLDGDGQHNPDEIPEILAPILHGEADVVIGSRFLGTEINIPRYRKFGIHLITFLYNIGSKVKISDAQSGFRAYNRKVINTITITSSGMAASAELIIKIRDEGFTIGEVPISCIYHASSHNLNPIFHGLNVALAVIRLRFMRLLLRLLSSRPDQNAS